MAPFLAASHTVHTQAMDRAHRLGQTRTVNVYRLLTRGTLEERIMGLQRFKLDVANAVVNTDNASLASMDTSQILHLFAPPSQASKQPQAMPAIAANGVALSLQPVFNCAHNMLRLFHAAMALL